MEKVSTFADFVYILRQKAAEGVLIGGEYSPQSGLDAHDHYEARMAEWRLWLYEKLPGELRQSGRWIIAAEKWIDAVDTKWAQEGEDGVPLPADSGVIEELFTEQNVRSMLELL